jgi:hypothetical protein
MPVLTRSIGVGGLLGLSLTGLIAVALAAEPAPAPGATGDVAGHVPAQAEQAQRAPVSATRSPPAFDWWSPGDGRRMLEFAKYRSSVGQVGVLLEGGPLETRGHPFFEPIGTNGRACVTCHQPENAMSISVESIQERWRATQGKDPLFAAVDGSNCPDLPAADPASHSLLLQRGLFRVFLPWPPKAADGTAIDPEFKLEVVRDPTGCNSSAKYGLKSSNPMVSVYRRPRVVANMPYVTHQNFGVGAFVGKNGSPSSRDPDTGKPVSMNLMSDARQPTLKTQAVEAAINHLQAAQPPTAKQLEQITAFERRVFVAQVERDGAGSLVEADGPPAFGPRNLASDEPGVLGNNTTRFVFPMGEAWTKPQPNDVADMRASIRRGHDVFFLRTFWIRDSMHLNTVGLGNPTKRTCATCHGMHMTAMDVANGWMDIGTTNQPWARETPENPWTKEKPQMPLFRIECKSEVPPHPYLGRVFYTQDPGRALISGKCNDVGTIVMQQFRGLAARAPYFSNGSASSLRELIDFYDRRYNIQYSEQERLDLEHFLGSL